MGGSRQIAVLIGVVGLLAVLAASGCADSAALCEARLTPINANGAAVEPLPSKGARP